MSGKFKAKIGFIIALKQDARADMKIFGGGDI